jgi:hypothetical protein
LDPAHTRQYGLVAEEVAQLAPQLVVFDDNGVAQTVRFHFVNAMLLNELQKQRQLIEEQKKANEEQQSTTAKQHAQLQDLAARLAILHVQTSRRGKLRKSCTGPELNRNFVSNAKLSGTLH